MTRPAAGDLIADPHADLLHWTTRVGLVLAWLVVATPRGAMSAVLAFSGDTSPVGDTITLVAWSVLAACALRLVWLRPRGQRGAWLVVALYCTVVAVDKAVDLQVACYHFATWCLDVLDPSRTLRQHRRIARVVLLMPILVVAVGGTAWLVHRDRALDLAKLLAIAGLVLVILMVGARGLPGFGFLDEAACWAIEGVACLAIAAGLWRGYRHDGRPAT